MEDSGLELRPDPARVALRLFLPGEEMPEGRSRVDETVDRVLVLCVDECTDVAEQLVESFQNRSERWVEAVLEHANTVAVYVDPGIALTDSQRLVLGAAFTCEYAVEAASLCNPSVVPHPDQSGLEPHQFRVAVSLRGIGEGHMSSIGFASAVIGPGDSWQFDERRLPLVDATISEGTWTRKSFRDALGDAGLIGEVSTTVLGSLPELFSTSHLEASIRSLSPELAHRRGAGRTIELMRATLASAYGAHFSASSDLSQRVLHPVTAEESRGMEDARFVLTENPDGTTLYRATYTAHDGVTVVPRLITSADLATFQIHRLSGSAATNKGMALFPRPVNGRLLSLTRADGETLGLAQSTDGMRWDAIATIHKPTSLWEVVQTGNCGSPLETAHGWLVLTHGVGPMRRYSIGAVLLDLEEPEKVIAVLSEPLLEVPASERDGYVPNVVYSCGGIIHDGTLWLPYGVGDSRVRVAHVDIDDVVQAMTPVVR